MILRIPTSTTESSYLQRTSLDGVDYTLRLQWNQRDEAWYLTLSTADDELIVGGIKVVAGWPLLRGIVDPRRPPGELVVVGPRPGLRDLGASARLLYLDAAEVAAFRDDPPRPPATLVEDLGPGEPLDGI